MIDLETIRTKETDLTEPDGGNGNADPLHPARARVDVISDERLVQLFSLPRSPRRLIAGLRALGFSASSVEFMTGARSRDVVYSWARGRAKPGIEQAERLDEIRRILHFICGHSELGPETAWMLFNAKFGTMDQDGPTAMELIAKGEAAAVMRHVEDLVGDGHEEEDDDGGSPRKPTPEPKTPSGSAARAQPTGTEG